MVHTRFVGTEDAAESDFAEMKSAIETILAMTERYEASADRSNYEAVIDEIERLVHRFP